MLVFTTPKKLNPTKPIQALCGAKFMGKSLNHIRLICKISCVSKAKNKVDRSIFLKLGTIDRAGFTAKSVNEMTIKPSGLLKGARNNCIKNRSKNTSVSRFKTVLSKKLSALVNIVLVPLGLKFKTLRFLTGFTGFTGLTGLTGFTDSTSLTGVTN